MTQCTNNYDDVAIARAKEFANGQNLSHSHIEKPAMYGLLPALSGRRVLCLGCGTGEECAELAARGARVHGVDVSEVSIDYAQQTVPEATFEVIDINKDMHKLRNHAPFDLVYSGLTVHYVKDILALFDTLHDLLTDDGHLLFSTCHPVKWSAEGHRDPQDDGKKSFIMGYERNGSSTKVYGDYLGEQHLRQHYPNGLVADYWMRPPSAYFKLLKESGFEVLEFLEPSALSEARDIDPVFWEIHHKIPQWVVFLAKKRS